ncbi:hypothetical protein Taro_020292 [Colocasia esculenta]|uniref:Transposase n=1 Tax=Colocasia esculenta TaxID=4460 RepID=A0A843UVW0_COLES|nr:hypothetical protein [Colocasia esculenta]
MASTGEHSSRDGSCPRRLRTLSVPLPPTSQAIPPRPTSQGLPPAPTSQQLPLPLTLQQIPPTSSPQGSSAASASSVVHLHHLHDLGGGALAVEGRLGELRRGDALMDNNGMSPLSEAMASALLQITLRVVWALYQSDFVLHFTYKWERTEQTDREMLAHMSAMHRSWRSKQKKRHFNGKPLDDAIVSVPAGVDPSDWQTMCELWTTGDERRIADRNKQNRTTQSMPYRRGRTSHYQLMRDFSQMHGRTPHRLEVFKMGRCKHLSDGIEGWVDEESRRRYEAMSEMIAPFDVDAESHTTATPEDAFISVMGKDRPGRVRCAGSGETLRTWYESTSTGPSAYSKREKQMQEQLKVQEDKLKAQADKMNQMEEKISQLQSVASKVDEMSVLLSQIQAS